MAQFMLDTNIFADFFNRIPEAVDIFADIPAKEMAMSAVTYAETLVGFDNSEDELRFEQMVVQIRFLIIDKQTAKIAAELRKKYNWKLPDAYQAALATQHSMILLTRNAKDFDPAVHKFVKIPYRVKKS